ncbi:hypothetical protein [Aerosakkonema funiforme]|uniref:hypothetical protein n=1 Tax=Aerosakkonema funiforme TaxID=1246630 RepID=UPI0035BBEC8A
MKLRSHIGKDGILQIEMPTDLKDTSVEVVVVVQPLSSEDTKPEYNAWRKLTTKKWKKREVRFTCVNPK